MPGQTLLIGLLVFPAPPTGIRPLLGGLSISDDAKSKPRRRFKELIEREITYFGDVKKQRSKTIDLTQTNPEKLTIAKGGDWEVFCYPYSNTQYVFLRVRNSIELFDLKDLTRLFSRISARLRRYSLRLTSGVKKRNVSGCAFQRAYDSGVARQFGLESQNKKEHTLRIVAHNTKGKAIAFFMYMYHVDRESAEQMYEMNRRKHRGE